MQRKTIETKRKKNEWAREYMKEKYYLRWEEINAKIECDVCGSFTAKRHMARHKRSIKCQNARKIIKGEDN